jgi:hypothetical protein
MKKIFILSDHRYLSGSLINLLDFQQYLKDVENYKITFICEDKLINHNLIKLTNRKYTFDRLDKIKDVIIIKGCLITDFKSLCSTYLNGKRILADKCVVVDNIELSFYLDKRSDTHLYYDIDIYDCLNYHKVKDFIFLMPRFNKEIWDDIYSDVKSEVFYKKINIDLLNDMNIENNGKLFFRSYNFYLDETMVNFTNISNIIKNKYPDSVELNLLNYKNIFSYKGYIYCKKPETYYFEQFGRLIFEYILLGKEIHWFDNPYEYDDGLKEYLNYYGEDKDQIEYLMKQKYEERPWE